VVGLQVGRRLFARSGDRLRLADVLVVGNRGELGVDKAELSFGGLDVLELLTSLAVGLLDAGERLLRPLSQGADLLARVMQERHHLQRFLRSTLTALSWGW